LTRIFTIIGARPQFIKAAAVSRRISEKPQLQETLVHTGQHYDANMSDVFFEEMEIRKPEHYLGIAGGGHGAMTGRMLMALEELFLAERPDMVMIYGDTNSTLAGALAAAKLHIPVAHVEAGLRSFNKRMPEEINRILTDQCAAVLFTPTATATQNLLHEGFDPAYIVECGDVMFDASLHFSEKSIAQGKGAARYGLKPGAYVLATVHRQENTDDLARLRAIIEGLAQVASELPVVLPLHPRTRARVEEAKLSEMLTAITVIEPVGYLDMVGLERGAAIIATDSGGVQKEAFFHKVPCVTLRDETEWGELVEAGWNTLVSPTSAETIRYAILQARGRLGSDISPYGTGDAASIIVANIAKTML
jgi:UDP-GlcNAc3NAcA epimerase